MQVSARRLQGPCSGNQTCKDILREHFEVDLSITTIHLMNVSLCLEMIIDGPLAEQR